MKLDLKKYLTDLKIDQIIQIKLLLLINRLIQTCPIVKIDLFLYLLEKFLFYCLVCPN